MKQELTQFLIALFLFTVTCLIVSESIADTDNCEAYTRNFLKNSDRLEQALELLPIVKRESLKHGIDPIIPTVIISLESSWDTTSKGGIGELGLMQVLPHGVCGKGQDLSTPEGQIIAGVNCLAMSRDACGNDLNKILTIYASGKCVSKSAITKRKINHRVSLIERWSK